MHRINLNDYELKHLCKAMTVYVNARNAYVTLLNKQLGEGKGTKDDVAYETELAKQADRILIKLLRVGVKGRPPKPRGDEQMGVRKEAGTSQANCKYCEKPVEQKWSKICNHCKNYPLDRPDRSPCIAAMNKFLYSGSPS